MSKLLSAAFSILALLLSTNAARADEGPWELGIDDSHLSSKDPRAREKAIDDIHGLGAVWIRFVADSGSKQGLANLADTVSRAKKQKLQVLLNIVQLDVDYDDNNDQAPLNKSGWKEKKLSRINLKKFRQRVEALCDALKGQNLNVDAFEIGNEDDQNPYDADIPAENRPQTPDEIHTWLLGYGKFLQAAAEVLHKPDNYPQAKIITFGMAHIPDAPNAVGHLSLPAQYVRMLTNVDGDNYLHGKNYDITGFGSHVYVSPSNIRKDAQRTIREDLWTINNLKPLWITECGFLRPYKDFPNKENQTLVQGLTEFLDTLDRLHERIPFGPICYYDYANLVDARGDFQPIADVLSKRAGHWKRLYEQTHWQK